MTNTAQPVSVDATTALLDLILAELVKANAEEEPASPPTIIELPRTSHVQYRVKTWIFSASQATVVSLTIGTRVWSFNVDVGINEVNMPYVVGRGVDVSASPSAGTLFAYAVADVE